jgi:hypothetical protein
VAQEDGQAGGGFWRGFGLGLILVAAALLVLALAVPPPPPVPPDLAPEAAEAPPAPPAPSATRQPAPQVAPAASGGLLRSTGGADAAVTPGTALPPTGTDPSLVPLE